MMKLNTSQLPGTHRDRVFVGGSYARDNEKLLHGLATAVRDRRFVPIIANDFDLLHPDRDIHDVTLWLLHACRLAIFEVSTLSGALMELERLSDYGLRKALLLYQHPGGLPWPRIPAAWRTTQMLKSLAIEHQDRLVVRPYTRPVDAFGEAGNFLRAVRRSAYGKLHRL
jgi:hypothetical protein